MMVWPAVNALWSIREATNYAKLVEQLSGGKVERVVNSKLRFKHYFTLGALLNIHTTHSTKVILQL